MAQLRHDNQKFKALNTEVLVMVPNGPKMIEWYINSHAIPYPILSDKGARVAELYCVNTKRASLLPSIAVFKPGVFLVDTMGTIRYTNYASYYTQEPDNREPLAILAHRLDSVVMASAGESNSELF